MENQLIMEKENSVWTKTQLLVFYVVILLAIDEYVFSFRVVPSWFVASGGGDSCKHTNDGSALQKRTNDTQLGMPVAIP
jgi:hypothetical protein